MTKLGALPYIVLLKLYASQKQLPREMKSRLPTRKCAGYIFWQLFLWRLYSQTSIIRASVIRGPRLSAVFDAKT